MARISAIVCEENQLKMSKKLDRIIQQLNANKQIAILVPFKNLTMIEAKYIEEL